MKAGSKNYHVILFEGKGNCKGYNRNAFVKRLEIEKELVKNENV